MKELASVPLSAECLCEREEMGGRMGRGCQCSGARDNMARRERYPFPSPCLIPNSLWGGDSPG